MANGSDNQGCSSFATMFAQLFARTLNSAAGSAWQVGLASPPSPRLPTIETPVHYCLRFGEQLRGSCYLVLSQAQISVFSGQPQPPAKDADMVADAAQLVEPPAAALLELMRSLAAKLPDSLAALHGRVTVVAEQVEALDSNAAHALELQARDGKGKTVLLMLHFDVDMQAALEAAVPKPPVPPVMNKEEMQSLVQGNLGLVMDVELSCTLRFGQRQLSLREILDLASGSVVELDRQVDEPVELILDGRVIARGEAVVIDGNYGLRVTQVLHNVSF